MPASTAPSKTALGLEELQRRTRRLGQRYRTVLLLVDGRRPLGEVLAMALSAGADTSHFEELVKLGLVEVPLSAAAPEPRDSGPIPLDVPTLTSVAYDVPGLPAAPTAPIPTALPVLPPSPITVTAQEDEAPPVHVEPIRITTAPEKAPPRRKRPVAERDERIEPVMLRELPGVPDPDTGPDTVANPEVEPIAEAAPAPASAPMPEPPPAPAPEPTPSPPPPAVSAPVARAVPKAVRSRPAQVPAQVPAQATAPGGGPPLMTDAVPAPAKRSKKTAKVKEAVELAFQVADHARPRKPMAPDKMLQDVRSLLMGAMGAEAALFSPMTLARLRNAQTHKDMISLVWEIERQRSHVNRSRAQLFSLERARDLLGMGNTVVAGDSQADTTWPDTQGESD